jgi:hypothetical protein
MNDRAVHDHAARVAADRLLRSTALLGRLDPDERREIERLAYAVAAAVAECLLEDAERSPAVAAALQSWSSPRRGSVSQSPVPRSAHAAS